MDKITQYLNDFNEVADNWFAKATFVEENYQFFKQFFEKENLEKGLLRRGATEFRQISPFSLRP